MALTPDEFIEKWQGGYYGLAIGRDLMKAHLEEMLETPVRALRRSCEVLGMYQAKFKELGIEDPLQAHIKALDTISQSIVAKEDGRNE